MADSHREIQTLVDRMAVLAGNESGLDDGQRRAEIIDISYHYTMLSFPEFATYRGDPRGQDRWTDQSEEAVLKRRSEEDIYFSALQNINRDNLRASDRVNHELLFNQVEEQIEGRQFPGEFMPINQMGGPQQDIAQLMAIMQANSRDDYENMIARLEGRSGNAHRRSLKPPFSGCAKAWQQV